MTEKTIFELSRPGRRGVRFPEPDGPLAELPKDFLRSDLPLPEMPENEVVRHFTKISQFNHAVDIGFYPLGSCTMKYNPKINEEIARLPGFSQIHPLQTQEWLAEISGFDAVSLQPAAGAHGELTGVLIIRAYHNDRGDTKRTKMLVPDSAHGTNPASSAMSGMTMVEIPSDKNGNINLEILKEECDDTVAGLMITNPNTLGLFDENINEATQLIHDCGGLVYGDGANMNALLGIYKPAQNGIDVMHFNLHKTFSTPHGGGGPGSGPVGVIEKLADFLPDPHVEMTFEGDDDNPPFYDLVTPKKTIGRVKAFQGHFGVIVRAFTYMISLGKDGLLDVSTTAVLNANYIQALVRDVYHIPYERLCMHEFVTEAKWDDAPGIKALDISKRLIDFGFHPPTNYFPLIVPEALMIEPTETETKETLDAFADAMLQIADEAKNDPDILHNAPTNAPFGRLDEVKAAKELVLKTTLPEDYGK
ncbi:MAG: aminomethyl-transferring glycine dehydrogenase subunit GcvPB [Anaerolineales bacterium]